MQCDGKKLTGRVADMRESLKPLLPVGSSRALQFPEYPTQDDCFDDAEESEEGEGGDGGSEEDDESDGPHIQLPVSFDELHVGGCVEVYWKGEDKWYEGEVTDLDDKDMTFEILYIDDDKKL